MNDHELRDILDLADGLPVDEEIVNALATDDEALDRYTDAIILNSLLHERTGGVEAFHLDRAEAKADLAIVEPASSTYSLSAYRSPLYALAAAIVLAASAFAIYLATSSLSGPDASVRADAPIATLIDAAPGIDVFVDDDLANTGSEYRAGRYMIREGSAELQLTSGASVRMLGFTDLSMHNAMRSTLTRGTAVIACPKSAVGYTVVLPGDVKVVDLGTRFAIRVDDHAHAVVQVLEGRVAIETPAGSHVLTAGVVHEVVDGASTPITDVARFVVAPLAPPVDADRYANAVRALGPIAYWTGEAPIDGESLDTIGNRPAKVQGDITTDGTADNPHFEFDGSGHLIVASDAPLDSPGQQMSVSAWVRLGSAEHQAIVHKWSQGLGFSLEVYEHKPGFVVAFAGEPAKVVHVKADRPMPVDRWVHLVGVCDGQTVSIYIDGVLAAGVAVPEIDATINESRGPVTIGRRSDDLSPDGAVRGAIDDIAIFDRALSAQEIADLYRPE